MRKPKYINKEKYIVMKNNQGMSLIILSITIIVLIILAGVSFAMLVGENGIFISKEKAEIKEAKKVINQAIEDIKKEAITKITENSNILEYYQSIDLSKYGLDTSKGYKLVTEDGNEAKGISQDGIIAIKYENKNSEISVIGKIDFKIDINNEENKDTSGSLYGTIEKAHEK